MPSVPNDPHHGRSVAGPRLAGKATALLAGLLIPLLLQGCAAVVVAGVATGASVAHDRRSAATVLADDTIELQAMKLLYEHPDIAARSSISINSYNQVALLTGQAESSEVGRRFADLVARLPKVKTVVNEVGVGPSAGLTEASKDLYLASRCKLAIASIKIPDFDPLRVHVVSSAGKVYLLGLVTSEEAAAVVEEVRYVPGVVQVVKLFEYIDKTA